jgi:hypothetical protein
MMNWDGTRKDEIDPNNPRLLLAPWEYRPPKYPPGFGVADDQKRHYSRRPPPVPRLLKETARMSTGGKAPRKRPGRVKTAAETAAEREACETEAAKKKKCEEGVNAMWALYELRPMPPLASGMFLLRLA